MAVQTAAWRAAAPPVSLYVLRPLVGLFMCTFWTATANLQPPVTIPHATTCVGRAVIAMLSLQPVISCKLHAHPIAAC